jgi:hypothetical protein
MKGTKKKEMRTKGKREGSLTCMETKKRKKDEKKTKKEEKGA